MKITDVELYSNNINFINFGVREVNPSARFMIRDITGLDADEIIPMFYGFSLETEGKFYDFGMKPREIVMKIALNPRFNLGEDYADVRDELYKAISSSRLGLITIHFNAAGTNVGKATAQITKFETVHFAQLPEVQITLRCDDPFFSSIDPVKYDLDDLNPNSSGALINPIVISDGLSTAPHGFWMEITFLAASPSFTIQDVPLGYEWKFAVFPAGGFTNGAKLYLSSDRRNKYLHMVQGSVVTYLMDRIDVSSIWPILFPGTNSFHIPEIDKLRIDLVEFYASYWGV
jgi:hypothetical protein